MEALYRRFESYDFSSDARFQEGVKKVKSPAPKEDLLQLKIFFYNRFVEPIPLSGYREWCALPDRSDPVAEEIRSVQDNVGTSESGKKCIFHRRPRRPGRPKMPSSLLQKCFD